MAGDASLSHTIVKCRSARRSRRSKNRSAPGVTAISAVVPSFVGASAENRPTNAVRRAVRRWSSSVNLDASTSSARSRVSSVTTGAASTSKCTTTSDPSSSRSRTSPRRWRSAEIAGASAASSRCSGRTPTTTSRPPSRPPASARSASSIDQTLPVPEHDRGRALGDVESALEEVHRRAADEARHEQVGGPRVQLLWIRDLLQLALAQHCHPLTECHRLDLVVRDVDRRHVELLVQEADLGAHLSAELGVEIGERLVHQERLWLADHRSAHRHPLALSSRQLARPSRQLLLELEHAGDPLHPLVDLAPSRASAA